MASSLWGSNKPIGDVSSWCRAACICRNSNVGSKGELTAGLSKVIVRSRVGEPVPGRKSCSVLSRLIFMWCADIHWAMSVRQAETRAATWVSDLGKERISWLSPNYTVRSVFQFSYRGQVLRDEIRKYELLLLHKKPTTIVKQWLMIWNTEHYWNASNKRKDTYLTCINV